MPAPQLLNQPLSEATVPVPIAIGTTGIGLRPGETIRLIGRDSRLSLLQIEIVRQKIATAFPGIKIEVIARSSKGDQLQHIPLHTVEGSDFFTRDIFEALRTGEADIAVHSLKDMSSEHFFGGNFFAIPDRDDTHDVAIFSASAIEKLQAGKSIVVGTCSPRREEMATVFLEKALPQWKGPARIETQPIRGNVETRLQKLNRGDYDATILAAAGLNRLLRSEQDAPLIRQLLSNKRIMVLPLVECVPAPCQGAIAAEANPSNAKAVAVLNRINDAGLSDQCVREKKTAAQYGKGCLQRFGVTTLTYENDAVIYAAGRDEAERSFSNWNLSVAPDTQGAFFSTTDHMGRFFEYRYPDEVIQPDAPVVYVSNYKAVRDEQLIDTLQHKKVWVAGTKTWYELARLGIWVEGCADALGLEWLEKVWSMPLTNIGRSNVQIITHGDGAVNWRQKGWRTIATYDTIDHQKQELVEQIAAADLIFWTGFRQYERYKNVLKVNVQHACPAGETAVLLRAAGVEPFIFPTIKAFQQWRKTFSR